MLKSEEVILVVVDVQGKLAEIVHDAEAVRRNVVRLIEGAKLFELPIVATEQVPEKLGETVAEVKDALGDVPRLRKETFSCWPEEAFQAALRDSARNVALVGGIEAHVCVHQTVIDLLENGFEVQLVTDAVSSRSPANKLAAVERARAEGAVLTTTEMALFELQHDCRGDRFPLLSRLVK